MPNPRAVKISIHALREEGDADYTGKSTAEVQFLSTPSARRATWQRYAPPTGCRYFYPRPPRGGRLLFDGLSALKRLISIHALREEGDLVAFCTVVVVRGFLSTPSARRATHFRQQVNAVDLISIHALREEGDCI